MSTSMWWVTVERLSIKVSYYSSVLVVLEYFTHARLWSFSLTTPEWKYSLQG